MGWTVGASRGAMWGEDEGSGVPEPTSIPGTRCRGPAAQRARCGERRHLLCARVAEPSGAARGGGAVRSEARGAGRGELCGAGCGAGCGAVVPRRGPAAVPLSAAPDPRGCAPPPRRAVALVPPRSSALPGLPRAAPDPGCPESLGSPHRVTGLSQLGHRALPTAPFFLPKPGTGFPLHHLQGPPWRSGHLRLQAQAEEREAGGAVAPSHPRDLYFSLEGPELCSVFPKSVLNFGSYEHRVS